MAGKTTIKGITVEIGGDTTKLGKALEGINQKSKNLSGELGQINRLLKFDPENTELLAQKQKVLADMIESTRAKLNTLKEAEKQVQEQFARGEVSAEQVRELQREIIATEGRLKSYEKAAQVTAETIEHLGKESDSAASDVEDVAQKAGKASKDVEDLGENAEKAGDGFNVADAALGQFLANLATNLFQSAASALKDMAESTREYRVAMGKLDTAFTTNGYSVEAAKETYEELNSILGDTDQSVEAANHLSILADNEETLKTWTEICTGVYAQFGDSLPIEGLTEASNETAKTGQITGVLADALNWAAAEGETFGVMLKENTKENEDWNKSVKEAASAEDYFNLALQECSSEQERQALITKTLNGMYSTAAKTYKKTNAEVIKSNKANEKWNATLAKVGKTIEPLNTEIKLMGVSLLEDAREPIEDIVDFVKNSVLPTVKGAITWITNNGTLVVSTIGTITGAVLAYKTATLAADIAQKALKASNPMGWIELAVGGIIGLITVLMTTTSDLTKTVEVLSDEEQKLVKAAKETADAYEKQQEARKNTMDGISAEMGHLSNLAEELQTIADKNGVVKDTDKARAEFILGELNNALGTEYTMTGNIIGQYDELVAGVNELIASKKAQLLLEANEEAYTEAIQKQGEAFRDAELAEKDYLAQLDATQKAEKAYTEYNEEYQKRRAQATTFAAQDAIRQEAIKNAALNEEWKKQKEILAEKETTWNQLAGLYGKYTADIARYEDASTQVLEKNYTTATAILVDKGGAYKTFADTVYGETERSIDALENEALQAAIEADKTKRNFEAGIDGYTQSMVDEAETGFEAAFKKFADAYDKAYGVGGYIGDGMSDGLESRRVALLKKAANITDAVFSQMKSTAQVNSPSRRSEELFEYIGEGAVIGLENKTKLLEKTGKRQVDTLMSAYTGLGNTFGQMAFRDVNAKNTRRQVENYQNVANGNAVMLKEILSAIKQGQILTIDADVLVGATAGRFDNQLGMRRALAARGAL